MLDNGSRFGERYIRQILIFLCHFRSISRQHKHHVRKKRKEEAINLRRIILIALSRKILTFQVANDQPIFQVSTMLSDFVKRRIALKMSVKLKRV